MYGFREWKIWTPEQNRAISLREAAILQSFPKKYQFFNPEEELKSSIVEKHIGNAVPPRLGFVIAKSIRKHLIQNYVS